MHYFNTAGPCNREEHYMINGEDVPELLSDDFQYVKDLGLVKEVGAYVLPSNPIYAEVIVRNMKL